MRVESLRTHYYGGKYHESGAEYEAKAQDVKTLVAVSAVVIVSEDGKNSCAVVQSQVVGLENKNAVAEFEPKKNKKRRAVARKGAYSRRDMRAANAQEE